MTSVRNGCIEEMELLNLPEGRLLFIPGALCSMSNYNYTAAHLVRRIFNLVLYCTLTKSPDRRWTMHLALVAKETMAYLVQSRASF